MADTDFQPEKRTVEDLFVGPDYYIIPRFQRPYSWDRGNLDEFWRDVTQDNKIGYFIGPMVAWRDPASSARRLVDGQQRLTTIAIIFAVLRDALNDLGENKLAAGIHRYLEKRNRDNELEFTLQTEVHAAFLSQAIFANPPATNVQPTSEEDEALEKAYKQIKQAVEEHVQSLRKPLEWLTETRDKLLGLKVIWVELGNEDDAYTIFETLNSRGKDLEVVDLLKNHLFNILRGTGNTRADVIRSRWNDMLAQLNTDGSRDRLDVNRFILHWWLSQEEYVAQRKLFLAIKAKIKTRPKAKDHLDSLIDCAPTYRAALEPTSKKWVLEESEVQRSLQALRDFRVVQPAPLLLALLRARYDPAVALGAGQLKSAVQTIERYHFQYTVISQLSSSGGVSEMYAKAARELFKANDPQARANVLDDIRAKLVTRAPERAVFISAFVSRFLFTSKNSREIKLVRYVLSSVLRSVAPSTNLDNLTIEHILPQEQITADPACEEWVGSLGNLLLVSADINTLLGNRDFAAKKTILGSNGRAYDIGGVLDREVWDQKAIEERAELLAARAYDMVWKLPIHRALVK